MEHRRDRSAGVIVFHGEGSELRLLLLRSRLTKRPIWEFPKGGIDDGETEFVAAMRELYEETGLGDGDIQLLDDFREVEQYRFTVDENGRRTVVSKEVVYFLARAEHRDVRISRTEASGFAWMDTEEAMRRVRYRARRRILGRALETIDRL